MSKKLGLENKYRQFIKPTKLGEYKAVMGKTKNITLEPTSKSFVERRMRLSGIKGSNLIKQAASSVLKKSPIGKVVSAIGKAVTSKPGMFGAGVGIGANVKDNNKKMGGGMMRYKTGNAVKLSARQKAIAAKAPPMNRIDGKDFAVLKAEKAKGRGQGLQDEKMKPGKIMKAKSGRLTSTDVANKSLSMKDVYELAKTYSSGKRMTSADVQKAKIKLKYKS